MLRWLNDAAAQLHLGDGDAQSPGQLLHDESL
jgi:hypothetical protein